jgi:pumilio family protein 6
MVLDNLVNTIGKSKVGDYIANPKGSRQFQQFIKLGTKEHRNSAIEALAKQVPDLAMRNIYALLTIEKIITYGLKSDESFTTSKILAPVMTERKIVEQLLFHRLGCKFLNKLYLHASIKPALKKQMLSIVLVPRTVELLGPSVENQRAHFIDTIKKCVDKELMGLEIIHKLFKQAVSEYGSDDKFHEEIMAMCADGLPHLLSSRDGVSAVVRLLGIATAKHKKNFIKELKGKFHEMAINSVTMVVLMRLFQVTDDTVLIGKSVLNELVGSEYEKLGELIFDQTGRVPILYALDGLEFATGRYYYAPDRQAITESPPKTSLKESSIKAEEINNKLIPSLLKVLKAKMDLAIESDFAKDVMVALLKRMTDGTAEKSELFEGVMAALADKIFNSDEPSQTIVTTANVLIKEIPVSAKMLLGSIVNMEIDWSVVCKTKAAFVITALLRCGFENVPADLKSILVANKKAIISISQGVKGTDHIKDEITAGEIKASGLGLDTMRSKYTAPKKLEVTITVQSVTEPTAKKQKVTDGDVENLFQDDDDGQEEMWGIVGDDDEYM